MTFSTPIYALLRGCFRLVPSRLRGHGWIAAAGRAVSGRFACHQQSIYSAEYYQKDVDQAAARSAGVMANSIVEKFHPGRVVDLGCGTGALLEALRNQQVDVVGLEYSEAGCEMCRSRELVVHQFDIRHDERPQDLGRFDLAVCCEVAEHLPERFADRLVDLLCELAPVVVFTGAQPGQGGTDHVNEQPHSYWIEKFESRSYDYHEEVTMQWRSRWKEDAVQFWYTDNVMVFGPRLQ